MLHFRNLSKSYNGRPIFRGIGHHFDVGAFALQGANGIGKSTLLALLAGAEPTDAGEIEIDGMSLYGAPLAARERLSYVPDDCPVYGFLTGQHFFEFIRSIRKIKSSDRFFGILKGFGIESQLNVRFDAMSLGTQKKFILSAAFIPESRVYIVDEPTNGLDKSSRSFLIKLVQKYKQRSVFLFSTHDNEFVQETGATVLQLESLISQCSTDSC